MKKRFYALVSCLIFIHSVLFRFFPISAYASDMGISEIGAISYMIAESSGLNISFNTGTTSNSVSSTIERSINNWLGDRTIPEAFGEEAARIVAGKLIVPVTLYNGIREFINSLVEDNDLESGDQIIFPGEVDGTVINNLNDFGLLDTGFSCDYTTSYGKQINFNLYYNRSRTNGGYSWTGGGYDTNVQAIGWTLKDYIASQDRVYITYAWSIDDSRTGETTYRTFTTYATNAHGAQKIAVGTGSISDGYTPTVLNPDQEWSGTIGGQDLPDTNLDQLVGQIYEDVADNNLTVEGEVIDIPVPTPTPMPIDPDTPLQDVPWEGLDNNLQQLYEQGLEETGKIGEAKEAITDAVGEQTEALEDAIADNAGVVSGAIDQAVSDVQTAIGEQTAALDESLSAIAEGVETIAEAIEDEAINWRKFDLRGIFPFCIPFDIYNMLNALDASPTAPHVQIPFVIQSLGFSYLIDLDFSAFDPVAAIMRQMELICYGLALAWATSKVIKW